MESAAVTEYPHFKKMTEFQKVMNLDCLDKSKMLVKE